MDGEQRPIARREPITDLEHIVGYPVAAQRPTRAALNPELWMKDHGRHDMASQYDAAS
jgi:hypothetical protein